MGLNINPQNASLTYEDVKEEFCDTIKGFDLSPAIAESSGLDVYINSFRGDPTIPDFDVTNNFDSSSESLTIVYYLRKKDNPNACQ